MAKNELGFWNKDSEATTLIGVTPATEEDKKILVNAIMSPEAKLGDYVNMQIPLVNFYMEKVTFGADEETDTPEREGIRTVLIDQDGTSYSTASSGVVNALRTIVSFYGMPAAWEKPLLVAVKQINVGTNRVYTLNVC